MKQENRVLRAIKRRVLDESIQFTEFPFRFRVNRKRWDISATVHKSFTFFVITGKKATIRHNPSGNLSAGDRYRERSSALLRKSVKVVFSSKILSNVSYIVQFLISTQLSQIHLIQERTASTLKLMLQPECVGRSCRSSS